MADVRSRHFQTILNIATGFVALLTQLATSFFLSSFIVANLGEAANGFTQLANNFVTYASLLTTAFNSMGARFMSFAHHRGEEDRVDTYYSTMLVCNILTGVVLAPLAVYVVMHLESFLDLGNTSLADVQMLFSCVFGNFFLNLLVSSLFSATFVTNRMSLQNLVNLVRNVVNALLLLVVFGALEPHVYYVSAVALAITAITVPVAWMIKGRLLPNLTFRPRSFSPVAIRELLSSGVWNTVNQCGNLLMTGFDLLMANMFVGAAEMGVLSVAKLVPTALISLARTLNSNIEPSLVAQYALHGEEGLLRELRSAMRLSNILVSVPIATFLAFAFSFYRLWMPTLDTDRLALLSFLSVMAFIPWAGPQVLNNVFTATNRLRVNSVSYVVGGLLNVLVVFLLLRTTTLGTYAIAGVSSIITIIRCLMVISPYVSYILHVPWWKFYPEALRSGLSCVTSFAVGRVMQLLLPPTTWVALVLGACVSACMSWVLVMILFYDARQRSRVLSHIVQRVRKRSQM